MTSKGPVNLATVAAELYGLDPESFTAARNARAREATTTGNRELAAAIKKLGKPTAAAWLANGLVRSRAATVAELIGLGPSLRRAQDDGRRDEMRRLVEQRRTLIGDLVRSASAAARDGGHSFGPSVARQLEETLEAAVADETLAGALREGQLTEPFRFVGFGQSSGSGGGPTATKAAVGKGRSKKGVGAITADRAREAEAEKRAAREAVAEKEASVEKARARVAAADERLERASKLMGEAEAEKEAAEEALRRARESLGPARRRPRKR